MSALPSFTVSINLKSLALPTSDCKLYQVKYTISNGSYEDFTAALSTSKLIGYFSYDIAIV